MLFFFFERENFHPGISIPPIGGEAGTIQTGKETIDEMIKCNPVSYTHLTLPTKA